MAFTYDFLAYERTRDDEQPQPILVHSRQRVWHASGNVSDDVIEAREYSDGFGRLIQKCAQAEVLAFGTNGDDVSLPSQPGSAPGPAVGQRDSNRVVVSGWQVYDNKGRVAGRFAGMPSVEQITAALDLKDGAPAAAARASAGWRSSLAAVPGIAFALLPKLACPAAGPRMRGC